MKKYYTAVLMIASLSIFAQQWRYLRPSNTGFGGDFFLCIHPDRCGNIWSGGYLPFWSEGSVVKFDGTTFTNWSNFEGFLPADRVYDLAFDADGGLWVASNGVGNGVAHGGISHFDGQTWTTWTSANSPLPQDDMRSIEIDHDGNIWATFWSAADGIGGVAHFTGTSWTIWASNNGTFPTDRVDGIAIDAQDRVWVATDNQGIYRYDGAGWTHIDNTNGLTGNGVRDVTFDPETNKLYAVTGNAVDIYDGSAWTHLNASNAPISTSGLWAVAAKGEKLVITTVGGSYLTYIFDGTSWSNFQESDL